MRGSAHTAVVTEGNTLEWNPPVLRANLSITDPYSSGIATPGCGLVRNDRFIDTLLINLYRLLWPLP